MKSLKQSLKLITNDSLVMLTMSWVVTTGLMQSQTIILDPHSVIELFVWCSSVLRSLPNLHHFLRLPKVRWLSSVFWHIWHYENSLQMHKYTLINDISPHCSRSAQLHKLYKSKVGFLWALQNSASKRLTRIAHLLRRLLYYPRYAKFLYIVQWNIIYRVGLLFVSREPHSSYS